MGKRWGIVILLLAVGCYLKREAIYSRLVVPDIVEWKRPSQRTPPLYGDRVVRQYFIPNFNGFFRVGFPIEYGQPSEGKIEVALREKDAGRELFKEAIPLNQFGRNRMRRFSFPPQWDSAGKVYCLNVSAPQAQLETDLRLLFDPGPFFHIDTRGKLYYGDRELSGELSMASECRVKVKKNEFISSGHRFLKDKGFALFYLGTIMVGAVSLFFTIFGIRSMDL